MAQMHQRARVALELESLRAREPRFAVRQRLERQQVELRRREQRAAPAEHRAQQRRAGSWRAQDEHCRRVLRAGARGCGAKRQRDRVTEAREVLRADRMPRRGVARGFPAQHPRDELGVVAVQVGLEPGDRRRVEHRRDVDGRAPVLLDLVDEARGLERAAAEREEVVVDADARNAERAFPHCGDGAGDRRLRRSVGGTRRGTRRAGQAERVRQKAALQFATRGPGDGRREVEDPRHLEIREARAEVIDQLRLGDRDTGFRHHRRRDLLAERRMRHGEGRRFRDRGVRKQRVVDFARRHLFAAAVDDFLDPPGQEQETVAIEVPFVPGAEPRAEEGGGRGRASASA